LRVDASFSLADHPELEVLIVPGGVVDAQLDRAGTISWIAAQSKTTEVVASVCTGAFLLGKAGLLNGKRATTHWEDLGGLRELLPDTRVIENRRWIDEGAVITSAGISAGIDMSLHLVARLAGRPLAEKTARQMDYEWKDS
jgi:transcriptional regulator GlxA family with amidase domain